MATISGFIIVGCWITFLAYWIVKAPGQKATAEPQSLLSALSHRIPVGLGWFLMIFQHFSPPLNQRLIPHTNLVLATGTAVCVFGLFITLWARRTLAGNWSSDVTFKQGHELVTTGPYQFVRHPIYTGLLVMLLGAAVAVGQLRCWLGVVVMGVGFWIKLKQEERLMLRHFPEQYSAYQDQVKALVPFVI
jgi:protein-S-isoprenylcysteine O-methyltransferase Ste14